MVTAKAKSSIYHLNAALSGLEKAQVHLIQARTSLPKTDTVGRAAVDSAAESLTSFVAAVEIAVTTVTDNNQSTKEEE
jgi:hypothetical protein